LPRTLLEREPVVADPVEGLALSGISACRAAQGRCEAFLWTRIRAKACVTHSGDKTGMGQPDACPGDWSRSMPAAAGARLASGPGIIVGQSAEDRIRELPFGLHQSARGLVAHDAVQSSSQGARSSISRELGRRQPGCGRGDCEVRLPLRSR